LLSRYGLPTISGDENSDGVLMYYGSKTGLVEQFHGEAECLGRLEVDTERKAGRKPDRAGHQDLHT
jgi:hypothetical protein